MKIDRGRSVIAIYRNPIHRHGRAGRIHDRYCLHRFRVARDPRGMRLPGPVEPLAEFPGCQ